MSSQYSQSRSTGVYEFFGDISLKYKDTTIVVYSVNEYNFNFRGWLSRMEGATVNIEKTLPVIHLVNQHILQTPEYLELYRNKRRELERKQRSITERLVEVFYLDEFLDDAYEGGYYTDNIGIWYKNKKYDCDRVVFTNESSTGKSCDVLLYKGDELILQYQRYSILTFFKTNYYSLTEEVSKIAINDKWQ